MAEKRSIAGKAPSQRQLRVGELARHALSDIILRGHVQNAIINSTFLTIPEVRLSPDLKIATVYLNTHEPLKLRGVIKALAEEKWIIRQELAKRLHLKYAPDLRFMEDETIIEAGRIDALLRRPAVKRDLEKDE